MAGSSIFKGSIGIILNVLFVLVALSLIVSDMAIYIDPAITWIPAFAGLAYVPLFVINILGLLYFLYRGKIYLLLPVLGIVIGLPTIPNSFSLHAAKPLSPKTDSSALRLLTWNIRGFEDMDGDPYQIGQDKMYANIEATNADIVCLQEVTFAGGNGSEEQQIASMKSRLSLPYLYFERQIGMLILSRYPIRKSGIVEFQDKFSGNQCLYADIEMKGRRLRIYNVHLESIRLSDNQVGYVSSVVKGKKASMQPTRKIAGQLKRAFDKRKEQVKLVKASIDSCESPFVICGDFNDPPASYAFHEMQKGLRNSFKEAGTGFMPITYNRSVFRYQIDHIMTSSNIDIKQHFILAKRLSDHYAVVSDFVIPSQSVDL